MAVAWNFTISQRVRIKTSDGGIYRPPSDSAKGGLGTIAPQLTSDWVGTFLELEPGTPQTYYVIIDGGVTELISEAWLEAAPNEPAA
jgi:hypothetical protein